MGDRAMLYIVDMDGTIVDFVGAMVDEHNKISGTNLSKEDIDEWDLTPFGIKTSTWQKPGFFYNLKPFEGAIEVLWKMYQNGNQIWIASDSMGQNFVETDKTKWIEEHIPFVRGVVFTGRKWELPGDILIDDSPEQLEKFSGITIKFNQPYNKHVKADHAVDSWKDIDRMVN